ncbi:cholecystokinin receptor-like, partial [Actinia tenebrosa]|uniref:Cholecystokinin receptor-like n=1 Tax=Actinia tenebrosa TaxID=6105 RepID=A0A6P8HWQ1_ACTTE
MDLDQGARLSIILVIFLLTTASNTSVGVLMYRFKNLRTIPNILILSSCTAEILNHIFNIPGFVAGYIVRDSKYFVGRCLALALAASTLFFTMVNIMSMTLMMVDRMCAFKFNLAYRVWRTRHKAFVAIAAKWISSFVISMVFLVPIWDIDLGNVAAREYRKVYFSKQGSFAAVLMSLFIINTVMIAIVTCTAIKHKSK